MIFIDRSIPRGVARALQNVRDDVLWFEDRFKHDTKDVQWLLQVGAWGWLVITRDKRIRSRRYERQEVVDAKVGMFCLTQGTDPTRWEYLKLLAKTLDEMERLFTVTPRPFIFAVDKDGHFHPAPLPPSATTDRPPDQ